MYAGEWLINEADEGNKTHWHLLGIYSRDLLFAGAYLNM